MNSDKLSIKLLNDLKQYALIFGEEFVLSSGEKSNFYVNTKNVTLVGERLLTLSQSIYEWFVQRGDFPSHLAGVSVGGDPIVSGVSVVAAQKGISSSILLVRKEKKSHGATSGRAVEGEGPEKVRSCWLLEDVISTGGSSLKAARFMAEEGYKLNGILCLVDREMGGVKKLENELSIPVESLYKFHQLFD